MTVRSGSTRESTATPARPLAAAGAHTACQPERSRSSAGSCPYSERTSWRQITSASVALSHSRKPFLAAARIPFTFTLVTTITQAAYPAPEAAAATGAGRRGMSPTFSS